MKRLRSILIVVGLILVLGVLGLWFYVQFEYTLVADLRELMHGEVDQQDERSYGAMLFETRGCSGCHRLGRGNGPSIGPDLTDIGARRDSEYIRVAIIDPGAFLAPCSDGPCRFTMPSFAEVLSEQQVAALVAYLQGQSEAHEHEGE